MRSAGWRFLIVGLLVLLMFVPLFFVSEVVGSRAEFSRGAVDEVGRVWGGPQLISGPMLIVPVEGPIKVEQPCPDGAPEDRRCFGDEIRTKSSIYIYPDTFEVNVESATEERRRGIFVVPVYTAEAVADFDFDLAVAPVLDEGERPLWDRTMLRVRVSENRALRGTAALTVDGDAAPLDPLTARNSGPGGFTSAIGDPRQSARYRLTLGFNGAESLQIAPVGRTSSIRIASDWPHPSFFGAFLPDRSEIAETGFSADWTIPHLARPLPQASRDDTDPIARAQTALGVRLIEPNDFYQKAFRAARYGILFIALTFLTVLLVEGRDGRPAHPVQYILIGLAQSIFVLLMVAYAEQIGFGWAYLLSSAATVALLTMFGATALKLGRRTLVLTMTLILLYAVLYLILQSADYALLAGASLAFVALGGTMWFTRNEDWYGPPRALGSGWFGTKPQAESAQTETPQS